MLPRVEGKPYEADYETSFVTKDADGEAHTHTTTGFMARDSAGRRFQQHDTMPPGADERPMVFFSESGSVTLQPCPRFAYIYDPVGSAWHWIDSAAGTTLMSIPVTLDQSGKYSSDVPVMEINGMSVPVPVGGVPQVGISIIGQKVIEGMNSTGYRSTADRNFEYWIADELEETILAPVRPSRR